ncbi:hypothetical protein K6119_12145 [Paracrocinitomix mangrovi]|uniref:hypothetical protein n=1 Tax=Paracrocinitomix mangrovi TaxID=2862509 RepID=UPI001C8E2E9E|nr:hypothetical protein [Paracrocinitomix mangrovi]UKN00482.1 hypothetical protein K6119_12145 [Paracrocinitomix mangrovi]
MLGGFIGLSVLLVFIMFMIMYARRRNQNKAELFKAFAESKGLEYGQSTQFLYMTPQLTGSVGDLTIRIDEKIIGKGKSKKVYTQIIFSDSPIKVDFKIGKETFFSKAGKIFGFKDIEFQDHQFDKTFLIKSSDESSFKAFLDYKKQALLSKNQHDLNGTLQCESGVFSYVSRMEIQKPSQITQLDHILELMLELQKN